MAPLLDLANTPLRLPASALSGGGESSVFVTELLAPQPHRARALKRIQRCIDRDSRGLGNPFPSGSDGPEAEVASMRSQHSAICPLCEATCGLKVSVEDGKVVTIRGDAEDPFSQGYLCPKGYALKAL